jgi:hypothetical protein
MPAVRPCCPHQGTAEPAGGFGTPVQAAPRRLVRMSLAPDRLLERQPPCTQARGFQFAADLGPGGVAGGLGDADQERGEPAQDDVGGCALPCDGGPGAGR